jgi:endonuclease/exonuclease/phosphatase (EEP) superfamily protein YafD
MAVTHPWLRALVIAGLVFGFGVNFLGFLARLWPALDIINNGLPFVAVGALLVLALAALTRDTRLIVTAALLAVLSGMLVLFALQGAAAIAEPGSARFLRVATFNLWYGNDRMPDVVKFLEATDADVVVLQEATQQHTAMLKQALGSRYPFSVGDRGLVILSKHRILTDGRIDRAGFPPWISLMLRFVTLDIDGTTIELAGVHLARPFYPELQQQDVEALINFVRSQSLPLVVAGDFNMSPWTEKLGRFTQSTGLGRYNTFHLTWPMRRGNLTLLPLVAIDNVFASKHFAKIGTEGGPRLGSDHRPIVADLALAASSQSAK